MIHSRRACGNVEKPVGFSKPLWESTLFVDFHSGVISTGFPLPNVSFFLVLFLSFRNSCVGSDRGALLDLFLELVVLQTFRESDTFPIELMDRAVMGQPVQ